MKFIKKIAAAAAASVMAVSMMAVTASAAQTNPVPAGKTEAQVDANWAKVTKYIESKSNEWAHVHEATEIEGAHSCLQRAIGDLDRAIQSDNVTKGDFDGDGLYTEYDSYVMRGFVSACRAHKLDKTTAAKIFGPASSYYTILDVNGDKIVNQDDTDLVVAACKKATVFYKNFAAKYAAYDVDMLGGPKYAFLCNANTVSPEWAELGVRGGVPYVDQNDVNAVINAKGTSNTKYDFNKNGTVDDSDVRTVKQAAAAYNDDFKKLVNAANPYAGELIVLQDEDIHST